MSPSVGTRPNPVRNVAITFHTALWYARMYMVRVRYLQYTHARVTVGTPWSSWKRNKQSEEE